MPRGPLIHLSFQFILLSNAKPTNRQGRATAFGDWVRRIVRIFAMTGRFPSSASSWSNEGNHVYFKQHKLISNFENDPRITLEWTLNAITVTL
jgi:hypothetical protein